MSYLLVFSTTSSLKEARKLAKILLRQRVAACINISFPLESHYWWKGKKEKAREVLLLIKTTTSAFRKLEDTLRSHHSFAVPEIIAVPIARGNPPYLAWLGREIKKRH